MELPHPQSMTALILAALAVAETPEKTVEAFFAALSARNASDMAIQVVGGKASSFTIPAEFPTFKATVGTAKVEGDVANLEVDVEMSVNGNAERRTSHETVHLQRVGDDWRIVVVDPETQRGDTKDMRITGMLAYMSIHGEAFTQAKRAAKKTVCLSNVKQLATATMLYMGDHDDVLPKTSAGWKAAIMPYLKNEAVFHCPEDASGKDSYFLDPRVAGKSATAIASPAQTAMIVEGNVKQSAFRHTGKATLGYVDGHAKSVDRTALFKARTVSLK